MSMRKRLLTTAAAAAFVGGLSSGAMAFDIVDWDWQGVVNSDFNIDVDVDVDDLDLDDLANNDAGVAQVEVGQGSAGNETATADVTDVIGVDVENTSLAAGNSQSLNASDLLLVHTGQFTHGGYILDDDNAEGTAALAALPPATGNNFYPVLALLTAAGAQYGAYPPATISSTATFGDTGAANAVVATNSASNTAAAFGNNASWTAGGENIASGTDEGAILIGDLTQFSFANVIASATMTNVAGNVAGTIGTPTVSNVANAIGNNFNLQVGVEPASD